MPAIDGVQGMLEELLLLGETVPYVLKVPQVKEEVVHQRGEVKLS